MDYFLLGIFICALVVFGVIFLSKQTKRYNNNELILKKQIEDFEENNNTNFLIITDKFWKNYLPQHLCANIIDLDDSYSFMEYIHLTKSNNKSYSVLIYTEGGSISSSDIMLYTFLNLKNVSIYIPLFAFSAGAMVALAGNNIYMNDYSLFGQVDPQIVYKSTENMDHEYSSAILRKWRKTKKTDEIDDDIYLASIDGDQLYYDTKRNLKKIFEIQHSYLKKEQIDKLLSELAVGRYPHHKPFTTNNLIKLGLNINTCMPEQINAITSTFINVKSLIEKKH